MIGCPETRRADAQRFTTPTTVHHLSLHATISNVSIHPPDTITYLLKCSKTNQHGPPQRVYLFRQESIPSPYEPICDLKSIENKPNPRPLFITETGATQSWYFRQVLARSGLPPASYSYYSFHIGAASAAASQGIPAHVIKVLGRWSSSAYLSYIHSNLNAIRNAHRCLST
ncbi:hypothetical protein EYF80_047019 [Liparis tanakae]|uniref:Uncharacterized protein n=1 Tax=Liparis tanakae TaxID=230148 RepID=A0A4Z2FPS8_9TELE|nr:hypothetical protein EYF80_047019 [Liparis tanakae]